MVRILETARAGLQLMQTWEVIEDIVLKEVKGLCGTCRHAESCVYHQTAVKKVIQCELFEFDLEQRPTLEAPAGLCKTCDNSHYCKLPGRKNGVWHCNQFQ
jgi:hypothetical protein